ncbi:hypothetical protein B0H10DRAFT_1674575, partial [Mycena sp. CBHHK59/15]
RSAPVHFHHVKAHSGNGHNEAADAAAKAGAAMPLPAGDYVPYSAPDVPLNVGPVLQDKKVFCDLPNVSQGANEPKEATASVPTLNSCHYAPHHGRALDHANLKRLIDVSSNSAAFWKAYRVMTTPRKKVPVVSLHELATCFESHMNAPDPPPQSFNIGFKKAAEDLANAIPVPSRDQSPSRTLSQLVTEDDIAWAKDHLDSHQKTAA